MCSSDLTFCCHASKFDNRLGTYPLWSPSVPGSAAAKSILAAMSSHSLGRRLLLAFGALAAALVLGEVVYRAFGPVLPVGAEEQGFILTPSGERVPSSEIYHFMVRRGDISDEGEGPRGHLQPSLETRMGYRHPLWAYYDRDGCITIRNNSLEIGRAHV